MTRTDSIRPRISKLLNSAQKLAVQKTDVSISLTEKTTSIAFYVQLNQPW